MNSYMEKIGTTLSVKKSILERFEEAVERTGLSKSKLFVLIIKHSLKCKMNQAVSMKSVKYQEKGTSDKLERMHVVVSGKDYEYMSDIRKMLKETVSLFFANAVNECLDEIITAIINDNLKEMDNYLTAGYISQCNWSDTTVKWTFYWGIPRNLSRRRYIEHLIC